MVLDGDKEQGRGAVLILYIKGNEKAPGIYKLTPINYIKSSKEYLTPRA